MSKPFVLFLLLCGITSASGQTRWEVKHSFEHFNKETGLVSNQVNSVAQDTSGYIWIATKDGLSRFDGIRYRTFFHDAADSLSIPSNDISQLTIDRQGRLWLVTADGNLGVFNTNNYRFQAARAKTADKQALKTSTKKLIYDEFGHLFLLLTGSELLTWNAEQYAFIADSSVVAVPANWKLNDLRQQPGTHFYWLAVQGLGLARYDAISHVMSSAGHNADSVPAITQMGSGAGFNELLFDRKGRLWFNNLDEASSTMYCFDLSHQRPLLAKRKFSDNIKGFYQLSGFLEQADGTIWFKGFRIFGRYLEQQHSFEFIPAGSIHEKAIDYRMISCLMEDREHNLWTGTANNGVFRFNPSLEHFANISHLSRHSKTVGDGNPTCFFRETDGTILMGVWSDGIYRYDSNLNVVPLHIRGIPDNNDVYAYNMCPSADGSTVWMASQPGLYAYDRKERSARYFNSPIFGNKALREVVEDKSRNLWIGSRNIGVFRWDHGRGQTKFETGLSRYEPIPPVPVNNIVVDSRNQVWIATQTAGLYVVDPKSDSIVLHFEGLQRGPFQLPEQTVSCLLQYNDSLMMIGNGHYLVEFNMNSRKMTWLTTEKSLRTEIMSIQKDARGILWVGTTSGLLRVVLNGGPMRLYDRNDGIINDYFILCASIGMPDGRLLFGTSSNILAFYPEQIGGDWDVPRVAITDVRLMNRSLPLDSLMQLGRLELGPTDNSLAIEFSTLTYSAKYPVLYRLDGLENQMRPAAETHQLIYSYLGPGTYRLRFAVASPAGTYQEMAPALTIRVNPPFWRTWWFYSTVFLALATTIYLLDRQRIQRIRTEQNLRASIASNLHQDVNTTLRNINVLSEIAAMKSDRQPEQAKDFLQDIQSKSRNMVVAMNDVLWGIDPVNDSMARTVERLQEIAMPMTDGGRLQIQWRIEPSVSSVKLNMKTRLEFIAIYKLILQLLLERCESPVTQVQLDRSKNTLQLKVLAVGMTMPERDATVTRLLNDISARAAPVGSVDSENESGGTSFLLVVRL